MKHGMGHNYHNMQNRADQKGEAHPESQPAVMESDAGYVMNSNDDKGQGPMGVAIQTPGPKETQPGTGAYG